MEDFIMKTWCVELTTPDNQVLGRLFLNLKEITVNEKPENPNQNPKNNGNGNGKYNDNGELLMTEKQKKELFRLSAEKGYENEEIHKKLLDYFGVEVLKDATYSQAQQLIEIMLKNKEKK